MNLGQRTFYVVAAVLIIAAGLLTRLPLLSLPWELAKPLGSVLWGAMVYCVIRAGWLRARLPLIAAVAAVVAAGVEFSQLWHTAGLDALRRTTSECR